MELKLNSLLASLHTLNNKLHNAHWFAKGPAFLTIHNLTEKYYDEVFVFVDDLAELMIQLEMTPKFHNKAIASLSLINDDIDLIGMPQEEVVKILVNDFKFIAAHIKELMGTSEDENINDLLLDFHKFFLKEQWILGSHIQ